MIDKDKIKETLLTAKAKVYWGAKGALEWVADHPLISACALSSAAAIVRSSHNLKIAKMNKEVRLRESEDRLERARLKYGANELEDEEL